MIHKGAWAEVSKDRIAHNISLIKEQVGEAVKICGVVKADAYGHGLKGFVRTLIKQRLTDIVAVGKFRELLNLSVKNIGEGTEILLLGVAETDELADALDSGEVIPRYSIFSGYSMEMLRKMDEVAALGKVTLKVHIRIDIWNSGMGMSPEEFRLYEDEIFSFSHLEVCGLYTHLYTAYSDDLEEIRSELECFKGLVDSVKPEYRKRLCVHALNSSLIFRFPEYAFDMVRAGTAMYGLPCGDGGRLQPVMRICARVFDVREVPAGIPLSYISSSEEGKEKRRIARVMLGYWDSPLMLTQKDVRVLINGRLYRPADEVCMDNLCIDVSENEKVCSGDTVILLGEPGVRVQDILERNGIDPVHSEWLCMTAERLEKIYI
ncbi:MAG: alanine racemase [Lachnospiraceae bacterium]|nr:alanine racemase [Lachnospiraceae bacterium]